MDRAQYVQAAGKAMNKRRVTLLVFVIAGVAIVGAVAGLRWVRRPPTFDFLGGRRPARRYTQREMISYRGIPSRCINLLYEYVLERDFSDVYAEARAELAALNWAHGSFPRLETKFFVHAVDPNDPPDVYIFLSEEGPDNNRVLVKIYVIQRRSSFVRWLSGLISRVRSL